MADKSSGIYHPRNPTDSPLWNLLNNHYDDFEKHYEEKYEKKYGYFRQVINEVVTEYLKCGDLKEGFARVRCQDCGHTYLLAFSCKGRWFCPSCHAMPCQKSDPVCRTGKGKYLVSDSSSSIRLQHPYNSSIFF